MRESGPVHDVDARAREGLIVAVFGQSDQLGGAERSTIELAAADQARGGRWLILQRDLGPGPIDALCQDLGVPTARVGGTAAAVRRLRQEAPEAVWAFGLRWSSMLRLALATGTVKNPDGDRSLMLVAQRGLDIWRRPRHNRFDRLTQRFVDAYVSNSHAATRRLVEGVHISPEKIATIHTGVSDEWTRTPRAADPTSNGAARIIMVGNDRPEKAYPDAFAVLARLSPESWKGTVYVSIAGDIRAQLAAAGLEDRVGIVTGHLVTTDDYDRADILLHASHAESYPRAVLESVARGLQVVAADTGDVAQILEGRGLFPVGDTDAAVQQLREAIDHAGDDRARPGGSAVLRSQTDVADDLRALILALRTSGQPLVSAASTAQSIPMV